MTNKIRQKNLINGVQLLINAACKEHRENGVLAKAIVELAIEYVKGCALTPEEIRKAVYNNVAKKGYIRHEDISHATISKVMEGLI
jgi:hypothetical protein